MPSYFPKVEACRISERSHLERTEVGHTVDVSAQKISFISKMLSTLT